MISFLYVKGVVHFIRAEKEAKWAKKACIKQLERSKREAEKEQKRMERQIQKEKLKAVSVNL